MEYSVRYQNSFMQIACYANPRLCTFSISAQVNTLTIYAHGDYIKLGNECHYKNTDT